MTEDIDVYVCTNCNAPSYEIASGTDVADTSYGGGHLVSERYSWTGSECCQAEVYEIPESIYKYEWPSDALEYDIITLAEYAEIIAELEEEDLE